MLLFWGRSLKFSNTEPQDYIRTSGCDLKKKKSNIYGESESFIKKEGLLEMD